MKQIPNIQNSLKRLETSTLNNASYWPVVSTASGIFRAMLAVVQIVAGIATMILSKKNDEETHYYGKHHFFHGVANLARSIVEIIPIVNLLTILYDYDNCGNEAKCTPNKARFEYIPFRPVEQ